MTRAEAEEHIIAGDFEPVLEAIGRGAKADERRAKCAHVIGFTFEEDTISKEVWRYTLDGKYYVLAFGEQGGPPVGRRIGGPFDTKEEAEETKTCSQ